jgi:F-type H+-transporting ATPase subunit b
MSEFLTSPETWVALAFIVFVVLVWKPTQKAILSALDDRSTRIQKELNEAARLREEAQGLLTQYQTKHRDAMKEAETILAHARSEAERLSQQAVRDLEASLKRREELAMQRIAHAEQQAAADVRAAAVDVAIAATERLLRDKLDGAKGDALIDQAIKELPGKLH